MVAGLLLICRLARLPPSISGSRHRSPATSIGLCRQSGKALPHPWRPRSPDTRSLPASPPCLNGSEHRLQTRSTTVSLASACGTTALRSRSTLSATSVCFWFAMTWRIRLAKGLSRIGLDNSSTPAIQNASMDDEIFRITGCKEDSEIGQALLGSPCHFRLFIGPGMTTSVKMTSIGQPALSTNFQARLRILCCQHAIAKIAQLFDNRVAQLFIILTTRWFRAADNRAGSGSSLRGSSSATDAAGTFFTVVPWPISL